MGYYVAFQDISSSKELRERMIPSIYYPIFHDAHNWDHPYQTDPWATFENIPEIIKTICENAVVNDILKNGTYHHFVPRFTGYIAASAEK